jgi:hypothetical protein
MLNETWRLLRALERSEIKRSNKHRRIQIPGRSSACVRVCLAKDGKVGTVHDISTAEWPTWTVMEGNQNSFPVIRIQEPLYHLSRDHKLWSEMGYDINGRRRLPANQDRIVALEAVLRNVDPQPLSKKTQTLWHRLRDQKSKELASCVESDPQLRSIASLVMRFSQLPESPEKVLKQVADIAIARLRQDRLHDIDFVEKLTVGKGPPDSRGKFPAMTVQLAFDIEDVEDYGPRVYSNTIRDRLIEKLPQDPSWKQAPRQSTQLKQHEIDAFTGKPDVLEKSNFPKVELPVPSANSNNGRIGRKRFPLVSMFSAARCNTRYGMTDANVFPLAKARATQLKEALEEITADNRREKTWQHVASGRFDSQSGRKVEKPDLLIAYVEEKPMIDVKTAGYFGQGQNITETKFEVDSAAVCEAFHGIVREKPQSKLNLFLIREVSRGQSQVVWATSPTVNEVLMSAERWQRAVRENVPDITLYLQPGKTFDKKEIPKVRDARPLAPYPDQVVRLLSYQWVRDGSSPMGKNGKQQRANRPIIGPGLGDVLAFMLRMEGKWQPAAMNMLSLLIRRVGSLLMGLFGAKHAFGPRHSQGKHEPFFDYPRSSREVALRTVAVLGVLLDALNSRKEDYMKETPYQIGQILALADTLHKDYCTFVRRGQMPNSLIGTSLVRRALDNPAGALADLGERMIEYVRWAKIVQISNDWPQDDQKRIAVNEARKKLRQYGSLAAALDSGNLPTECNDVMKAQLLLGFLANPPEENQDK